MFNLPGRSNLQVSTANNLVLLNIKLKYPSDWCWCVVYLHVSLQVLYPVQFPDVEVEELPVLHGEFSPEFVHVAVAPLPGVRRERGQGRGGLLHEAGDLDEEGFLAEDPENEVDEVCGAVVEDELAQLI